MQLRVCLPAWSFIAAGNIYRVCDVLVHLVLLVKQQKEGSVTPTPRAPTSRKCAVRKSEKCQ